MSTPMIARLQVAAESFVERLGNVGAMAMIAVPGRPAITIAAGHADRQRTRSLTPDLLFQIGSQTKTFTTMAMLLLAREGRLRLDDPIAALLDLPIDSRVTLEMLAMNTGGLGEFTELLLGPYFPGNLHLAPRDLVTMALAQGQVAEPGATFDYANVGFVLLALAVEKVTGQPIGAVVTERIARPLGLEDVYFGATGQWPRERMAGGYYRSHTSDGIWNSATGADMSWAYGTGDIITSPATMIRFGQALLDPGNAIGLSLADLTAKTMQATATPKFDLSLGAEYGYAIELQHWAGKPVWGHRGGTLGYNSGTWMDPHSGAVVTTYVTTIRDVTERSKTLALIRYPGPQLFTLALAAAHAITDGV